MKNIFLFVALFIIAFSNTKAQDLTDSDLAELENLGSTKTVPTQLKIKSGDTNLSLSQKDEEHGIQLNNYNTSSDRGRYSFILHSNADLMSPTSILGLEFLYAKRTDMGWWEIAASRIQASFKDIADINNSVLNATSTELENSTSTLLTLSTGFSYRSNLIQNFIARHDIYETTSAHIQYVTMSEEITAESLAGIGLKADIGVHKRSAKDVHYGLKMSYNIANVRRAAVDETETSSDRSLAVNWISLAFDLSYYF